MKFQIFCAVKTQQLYSTFSSTLGGKKFVRFFTNNLLFLGLSGTQSSIMSCSGIQRWIELKEEMGYPLARR